MRLRWLRLMLATCRFPSKRSLFPPSKPDGGNDRFPSVPVLLRGSTHKKNRQETFACAHDQSDSLYLAPELFVWAGGFIVDNGGALCYCYEASSTTPRGLERHKKSVPHTWCATALLPLSGDPLVDERWEGNPLHRADRTKTLGFLFLLPSSPRSPVFE